MATFIMLMNLTDEGIKGIKDAAARRAEAEKILGQLGGEIKASYMTMGSFDRVIVVDFPDGNGMAKFTIALGSRGFARSTTLRAFDTDEAAAIIAGAP